MALERRRAPVSEGLRAFKVERQAARVELAANAGPLAAALARTAVELACAGGGAAIILTRERAAGAALRGAREVGAEPRILSPKGAALLSARTPITLALQQARKAQAFESASALVADFIATRVAASGAAPGQTRAKVMSGLSKARDAAAAALDFPGARAAVQSQFSPSDPLAKKVIEAFGELERAEAAARTYRVPVSWSKLLAPSGTGRRAAVFIDLGALSEDDALQVEALSLASLAAALGEASAALEGGPLLVVCDLPGNPLGRFAALRLVEAPQGESSAVMALFMSRRDGPPASEFAEASWGALGLTLPSGVALPLAPAPDPSDPLSEAEARALTPKTLRERLLGEGAAEEGPDLGIPESPAAPRGVAAEESLSALRAATGDLEAVARRGPRAAAKPRPKKEGAYEASDFEI